MLSELAEKGWGRQQEGRRILVEYSPSGKPKSCFFAATGAVC